ncbi:MAG TPA: hypothetical protein VMV25_07790 [Steroidobacteraceae bacterium]|nr:hypothetical protein [Steroidobacteraceae bacterium]
MLERVVKLVVGRVSNPQGCAAAVGMIGVVVGMMSTVMTIIAVVVTVMVVAMVAVLVIVVDGDQPTSVLPGYNHATP